MLAEMTCELVDEEDVQPEWLTTMADNPYPGLLRDSVRLLADRIDAGAVLPAATADGERRR